MDTAFQLTSRMKKWKENFKFIKSVNYMRALSKWILFFVSNALFLFARQDSFRLLYLLNDALMVRKKKNAIKLEDPDYAFTQA